MQGVWGKCRKGKMGEGELEKIQLYLLDWFSLWHQLLCSTSHLGQHAPLIAWSSLSSSLSVLVASCSRWVHWAVTLSHPQTHQPGGPREPHTHTSVHVLYTWCAHLDVLPFSRLHLGMNSNYICECRDLAPPLPPFNNESCVFCSL